MKLLKIVKATTPVSDVYTDDPLAQSGQDNVKVFSELNLPNEFFLYLIKLGDKHCTRVNYGTAFALDQGILAGTPNDVMLRIKNKTAKIVLSWPLESFMEDSIFLQMHEYFKFHQIPLTSIIYLNCCPNGAELYQSFCERHMIGEERITTEYIPWYMYDKSVFTEPYIVGKRPKAFFSLNRRMHEHRCLMVTLMDRENLLEKFHMSFPSHHVGTNESFSEKTIGGYMPVLSRYGLTREDVERVEKKLPMVLDIKNWDPYPLPISSDVLVNFYQSSLISIVAETYFYSNVIHLTEKTFKPIVNHHPFIMVSAPNTLKVIKSFGFKTFDNIIDESYDSITDHHDRFDAIVNIIKEVSSWNTKQLSKTTNKVKEIVDYNYDLLHSRPRVELNNFVEKYGVENV